MNVGNSKEYNERELSVLSTCTGYGGIELGLSMGGVKHRTVAYVEIEAFAVANLVAAMEESAIPPAPIWTDLKTFDARPFYKGVDIITGGYPCQPFSNAGKREGGDDPRHLWPYLRRIVQTVQPIWCFFENVDGHLSMGYAEVYRDLRDLGYKVEAGIFSSEETGASHQRRRLFIMAKMDHSNSNANSEQITRGNRKADRIEKENGEKYSASLHTSGAIKQSKESMGNSECDYEGLRSEGRESFGISETSERLEQERDEVDDSIRIGDAEKWCNTTSIEFNQSSRMPIAPPQPFQFEWEEPRQITKDGFKSRLGLPTDGYDYRTDILRSQGNGVDPYVAKLAWETLIKKFK